MLVQVLGAIYIGGRLVDGWHRCYYNYKSGRRDSELHTHVADLLLRERESRARDKSPSSIGGVAIDSRRSNEIVHPLEGEIRPPFSSSTRMRIY